MTIAPSLEKYFKWTFYAVVAYVVISVIFHVHHAVMLHKTYVRVYPTQVHRHDETRVFPAPAVYGPVPAYNATANFNDPKWETRLPDQNPKDNDWQARVGMEQVKQEVVARDASIDQGLSAY